MTFDPILLGTRTIPLDAALALAGQGLGHAARPGPRVLDAARQAAEQASTLVEPRFIGAIRSIVDRLPDAVRLPDASLEGRAITAALEGATRVVAVVCTLGSALDDRISSLLADDPLLAMAFDGLGSAACEHLATDICREIEQQAAGEGNHVTGPLSPGMIGWPLRDAQGQVFALVDPTPIGVRLASSGQMIPRKTVSFVVGIGARVRAQSACPACGVRDHCRFRPQHG